MKWAELAPKDCFENPDIKNKFNTKQSSNAFDPQLFSGAGQHFWSVTMRTNPDWAIIFPAGHLSTIGRSQFIPLYSASLQQTVNFANKVLFLFLLFFKSFLNDFEMSDEKQEHIKTFKRREKVWSEPSPYQKATLPSLKVLQTVQEKELIIQVTNIDGQKPWKL